MGALLKKSRKTITIPVYLADTIWLPERYMKGPEYLITLDDKTIYVPEELLNNIAVYDQAMELAKEFARQHKGQDISLEFFLNFIKAQNFSVYPTLARKIYEIAEILKAFIDQDRDTIWAFALKNRFKPLFFKARFDFIMGNPPGSPSAIWNRLTRNLSSAKWPGSTASSPGGAISSPTWKWPLCFCCDPRTSI